MIVDNELPLRPERLACGGAVHAARRRPKPANRARWIERLTTAIAIVMVGGLIGFGLFVVGQ